MTPPIEFFQVDIGDGVKLDGWMLKPKTFDPAKKYPLLMYVYGEPAGVEVVDAWRGDRGLFHRALADAGYIVACVDNRGTPAPKGRAWRKVIYGIGRRARLEGPGRRGPEAPRRCARTSTASASRPGAGAAAAR